LKFEGSEVGVRSQETVDVREEAAAFEPIRRGAVAALRALSDQGQVEDVEATRGNLEFSLHFLRLFDTLLAEEAPELDARCRELRRAAPAEEDSPELLGVHARRALQALEDDEYDALPERLGHVMSHVEFGAELDAFAEHVQRHARLDERPGAPPDMTPEERVAAMRLPREDEVANIAVGLILFAKVFRERNEHHAHASSMWEDNILPKLEHLSEEHPGEVERAVAMNFPIWHDATDAFVFPLTNDLFNQAAMSCAGVDVADEAEFPRTQALTWRRLTRMVLEYYEGDPERAYWIDMIVRAVLRQGASLSGLAVAVVAIELFGAGEVAASRRLVGQARVDRRRRRGRYD
jgi:hypothetical protein